MLDQSEQWCWSSEPTRQCYAYPPLLGRAWNDPGSTVKSQYVGFGTGFGTRRHLKSISYVLPSLLASRTLPRCRPRQAKRRPSTDTRKLRGFDLTVTARGHKSFVVRYRASGVSRPVHDQEHSAAQNGAEAGGGYRPSGLQPVRSVSASSQWTCLPAAPDGRAQAGPQAMLCRSTMSEHKAQERPGR